MARKSTRKGKDGEREAVELLTIELALPDGQLRRGRQEWGGFREPDVVGVRGWWVEVKRAAPRLTEWLRKLVGDMTAARSRSKPLLMWRPNRGSWWVVLRLTDWCALVRERDFLLAENARFRRELDLPARAMPADPGPRQLRIDEVKS